MIMAGVDSPADERPPPEAAAQRTLEVLRRRVPPAVPGVMFLSGGQTEEEATRNLNLINQLAQKPAHASRSWRGCPWVLSFSFGRSLQASVLATWQGTQENFDAAVQVAGALAKANSQAQLGAFEGEHPSVLKGKSLHETHRGWGGASGGPAVAEGEKKEEEKKGEGEGKKEAGEESAGKEEQQPAEAAAAADGEASSS
jgi:fructose-bisphosphate aldolase, class I